MVRALHAAGIEVILDVVYNHTGEGNHLGPTLGFKGFDNPGYYRLSDEDPRYYMDYTGTGNSAQRAQPDLAPADHGLAALLGAGDARRRVPVRPGRRPGPRVLRGRPALDVLRGGAAGPGGQRGQADRRAVGRRAGRLPGRQLPTTVDRVERQVPGHRPRLLARRAGQPGRVRHPDQRLRRPLPGRRPPAGGQHQLRHLPRRLHPGRPGRLQRQAQRGQRRGQPRRLVDNRSWNCGVEGPTDDRDVLALRARQRRNFLATLFLSQGVPMLGHGDEMGRTQRGNNNGYCQDNELTWVDWDRGRRAPAGVRPQAGRVPGPAPDLPPPPVLHRRAGRRAGT